MALADALRSVTTSLTRQFGERVRMRSLTPGVFVPSTNTVATSELEWDDIPAAVDEVKYAGQESRLQVGDKKIIISAGAMVPEGFPNGTWEVDFNGSTYKVLLVNPVKVSGVVVVYLIYARGAPV